MAPRVVPLTLLLVISSIPCAFAQSLKGLTPDEYVAAIEKGRRALVKSCSDYVNAQGLGTLEAYVTNDKSATIRYFGTDRDRFRFEKCMAERGSPEETLLPKEKWRK